MLLLLEINFLHLILPVALLLAGWPPPLPRTHPFHRGEGGWCYDHDHGRGGGGGTRNLEHIYIYMILNDHHQPPKTTFNNPRNNQNTRGIVTGEISQNPNLETFCLKDFLVRAGTILHPPKVPRSRICRAKIPRIYWGDDTWVISLGLPPTSKNEYSTGIDSGTKFHRFKKCRGWQRALHSQEEHCFWHRQSMSK